ncbi:hypothetical protein BVC80_9101g203 [Macleaya cordata]|uniref:P-loop containing nucleoside triphosphate hydrolase n=1 Tax=Macleaya cordata TaxID=56857 RepID=A0A200QGY7_MACCD|nr:hypothetical protein BVC80_9101g203 [Macleaya cordata]
MVRSGKTSLLFQFAVNSALDKESRDGNSYVVFICNRSRLENKPPFLSQGMDPSSDVFQRIQMKYVEDDEGMKKYFAAFHMHQTFPLAVIVDNFGDFFHESNCQERYGNHRGRDLAIVRTLALCRDAIIHANERLESAGGGSCKLLLSETHHGDTPRSLFIYKRWVPSIFTIKGDGSGSFLLSSISSSGSTSASEPGRKNAAKYSIALQYLMLEEIIEETD